MSPVTTGVLFRTESMYVLTVYQETFFDLLPPLTRRGLSRFQESLRDPKVTLEELPVTHEEKARISVGLTRCYGSEQRPST